jgi:hypothetical protein
MKVIAKKNPLGSPNIIKNIFEIVFDVAEILANICRPRAMSSSGELRPHAEPDNGSLTSAHALWGMAQT